MGIISLHTVNSTNIGSIGYDKDLKRLYIKFLRTGIYAYKNVSEETYNQFNSTQSKGSYFFKNIKNKYECEKL